MEKKKPTIFYAYDKPNSMMSVTCFEIQQPQDDEKKEEEEEDINNVARH